MAKVRTRHVCAECGSSSAQWQGRCPGCGEWNTLVEELVPVAPAPGSRAAALAGCGAAGGGGAQPRPIGEVDAVAAATRPTGLGELDRVLGGGLSPGSVTLVGGEPGIGKSTLLLQAVAAMAYNGSRALVVSAEESAEQVRRRAERLGAIHPDIWLLSETSLPGVLAAIAEVGPDVVIVDSIQTIYDPAFESAPGSVTQVRECAHRLVHEAKTRGITCVLVGHVTKEGSLAGPRVLEHVVDTVLAFEGDRHHALRLLRAQKHRFGPTDELGVFEMAEGGLKAVPDPSGLFLGDRCPGIPGSVVVPTLEGRRPLLVEVQALTDSSNLTMPRRAASGLDSNRLTLLVAVLQRRAGLPLHKTDVWASVVGGVRLVEPGVDLAVALAVASASGGVPLAADLVACAELGLSGELRQPSHLARRLAEARRLGFRHAVVPASTPDGPDGLSLLRVPNLVAALDACGLR